MNHLVRRPEKRKYRVVKNGNPVLRQIAKPIEAIDDELKAIAEKMIVTMKENDIVGVGLAGPQVGISRRIIVIDTRCDDDDPTTMSPGELLLNPQMPLALVNPEIIGHSEEMETANEGCLSLPEINGKVTRSAEVVLKATLIDGREIQCQCRNLLARCLQHEIDHLDGILFVDKISEKERKAADYQLKKLAKAEQKYMPKSEKQP